MAEGLEEVMRKFALIDKEVDGVQLDGTYAFQEVAECQMSSIGKVVREKTANILGSNWISYFWGCF